MWSLLWIFLWISLLLISYVCISNNLIKRTVFTRSLLVMWRILLLLRRSTKLSEISVTIHILFFIVNFIETKQMQTCKRMIYRDIIDSYFFMSRGVEIHRIKYEKVIQLVIFTGYCSNYVINRGSLVEYEKCFPWWYPTNCDKKLFCIL